MSSSRYLHLYFEDVLKDSIPHIPRSYIEVFPLSRTINGESIYSLTPECVTAIEIIENADKMIKELEKIKKEAIKKYSAI